MQRLKIFYKEKVILKLQKELKIDNLMGVPHITKVTLNMGVSGALKDKKILKLAVKDLEMIAGQKPIITKSRKSIAGFKIREGWPIGCKVTLRRERMYDFLDRLISITLPRVRDFRGLNPRSFDGRGNYSMGIKEQISFPEIDYDQVNAIRGLDITITTTATSDYAGKALLRALNFPLKSERTIDNG